jgi:adenylosuccinate lyase
MLENLGATKGLIFSGQLLLALTNKGLSREDAYELVQRNAMRVWDEDRDFRELVKADSDIQKSLSGEEIDRVFSLEHYLRNVDAIYKRVGLE